MVESCLKHMLPKNNWRSNIHYAPMHQKEKTLFFFMGPINVCSRENVSKNRKFNVCP